MSKKLLSLHLKNEKHAEDAASQEVRSRHEGKGGQADCVYLGPYETSLVPNEGRPLETLKTSSEAGGWCVAEGEILRDKCKKCSSSCQAKAIIQRINK